MYGGDVFEIVVDVGLRSLLSVPHYAVSVVHSKVEEAWVFALVSLPMVRK